MWKWIQSSVFHQVGTRIDKVVNLISSASVTAFDTIFYIELHSYKIPSKLTHESSQSSISNSYINIHPGNPTLQAIYTYLVNICLPRITRNKHYRTQNRPWNHNKWRSGRTLASRQVPWYILSRVDLIISISIDSAAQCFNVRSETLTRPAQLGGTRSCQILGARDASSWYSTTPMMCRAQEKLARITFQIHSWRNW
jgi:hypothetical protein